MRQLRAAAVSYARDPRDARFFVQLTEILPAAEAAAGEFDQSEADVIEPGAISSITRCV